MYDGEAVRQLKKDKQNKPTITMVDVLRNVGADSSFT